MEIEKWKRRREKERGASGRLAFKHATAEFAKEQDDAHSVGRENSPAESDAIWRDRLRSDAMGVSGAPRFGTVFRRIDGHHLQKWTVALLRDWGVSLDLALYEEAVAHFCGRRGDPYCDTEILSGSRSLGVQHIQLAAPDIAVRITAWPTEDREAFEAHLCQFLEHTRLRAIQWINITPPLVQFTTLQA